MALEFLGALNMNDVSSRVGLVAFLNRCTCTCIAGMVKTASLDWIKAGRSIACRQTTDYLGKKNIAQTQKTGKQYFH